MIHYFLRYSYVFLDRESLFISWTNIDVEVLVHEERP